VALGAFRTQIALKPKGMMIALIRALICAFALCSTAANACTERTMLDLIGSLEAPQGYDQVYSGIRTPPPAPLTSRTVKEVLNWQGVAATTSVSTAAGRYQVIRPTLRGLVNAGVINEDDRFNAATQDKIGRHLLRSAGYPPNRKTLNTVANRISGIWAALPKVSGKGAGKSTYAGIAGNHALISADDYIGVITCQITVADALSGVGAVKAAIFLGDNLDALLATIKTVASQIATTFVNVSLSLLFTLFIIDFILMVGRVLIEGLPLTLFMQSFVSKVIIIGMAAFVIGLGPVIVNDALKSVLVLQSGDLPDLTMSDLLHNKILATVGLLESAGSDASYVTTFGIWAVVFVIYLTTALVIATILIAYAKLILMSVSAILLFGFAGLTTTRDVFFNAVAGVIAQSLAIFILLIVFYIGTDFVTVTHRNGDGMGPAFAILVAEIIMVVLCLSMPKIMSNLVTSTLWQRNG